MHKFIKTIVILLCCTTAFSLNVRAEDSSGDAKNSEVAISTLTTINDLVEGAKKLDGQEVTIQGEAIGERMDRGEFSWVNVNDGTNAIGVWIKRSDAKTIAYYGDYKNKGDIVEITGLFNRACKEHGGEADLHNTSLYIVEVGHQVKESISSAKIITTVIITALGMISLMLYVKVFRNRNS